MRPALVHISRRTLMPLPAANPYPAAARKNKRFSLAKTGGRVYGKRHSDTAYLRRGKLLPHSLSSSFARFGGANG